MARAIIFLTGGAILALELIASRVLTPFFGVSLYIWSGILAITLLCLAFGYGYGSTFTRRAPRETLVCAFYALPAVAGMSIALACALYPAVLGPLARFDLLTGSFIAATVLLAVPLIALSALNPILVAIERTTFGSSRGDAGAGRIFFISTAGSVAGVLAAAFYLIPNWSSIEALAQIGLLLGALALAGLMAGPDLRFVHRLWITGAATMAILGSAALLIAWADGGAGRSVATGDGRNYSIVASRPSPFGAIKVVDFSESDQDVRLLLNDGIRQNAIYRDGRSASPFTYILDAVAAELQPEAQRVLVLGLGAGVIPTAFATRGAWVDAVEINPRMPDVAARYFGFTPRPSITLQVADARTFVRACSGVYDLVFVDLFVGDGTPEHLMTRQFLSDVRLCLAARGSVAVNGFLDPQYPASYGAFLATFADVFGALAFTHIPLGATSSNAFVFGTRTGEGLTSLQGMRGDSDRVPPPLRPIVEATLGSITTVGPGDSPFLAKQAILSDENGRLSMLAAPAQMAYRQRVVRSIPDALLIN